MKEQVRKGTVPTGASQNDSSGNVTDAGGNVTVTAFTTPAPKEIEEKGKGFQVFPSFSKITPFILLFVILLLSSLYILHFKV